MSALSDFFAMGGHGPFVWGAYAVALLLIGGLGLASWRGYVGARDEVARLESMARRGRG